VALLARALGLTREEEAALEATVPRRRGPVGAPTQPEPHGPLLQTPPTVQARDSALPPLVGRMRELATLERHLASERPALLVLAGEPGIGKSRLLREAARLAVARGLRVLADGCQRRGGQDPFAPLLGAIKRCIASRPPDGLRADLRGCAWLVRLLPELAGGPIEPLPAWSPAPEQERRLLFEAVGRFLANVAGPSGTLLVLDDLQWAGPDALDLLATLVRGSAESPLRVVAAFRDTEMRARDPLAATLADLAHADLVIRCPIGPLARDEARALLAALLEGAETVAPALEDALLRRAGGVPFYMISFARALDPAGAGAAERIPWSLAQSIKQRVTLLPEPAAEVLAVAALIGRVVPHALLLRVAGKAEQEVFATLEAAQRARLLQEEGDAYQFAHDLIREVLEEDVGVARRAALHRRIGESLEQDADAQPEALAYHFERGGDRERAARYLERAGDRAQERQAHGVAAGYYREAVAHLASLGRALDLARVRLQLGTTLLIQAHYEAALAALEPAAAAFHQAGDRANLARTLAQIGEVHALWGTYVEGLAHLRRWLEPLEAGGPTSGLAALYAEVSALHYMDSQFEEALTAAERGVALAQALGDEQVLADAQTCRGCALTRLGRRTEARAALAEAIRLGEATRAWTLPVALQDLARITFYAGDFAACRRLMDRAVEVAEQRGDPYELVAVLTGRGLMAFYRGDWAEARTDLDRGLALSRRAGTLAISAFPPLFMAPFSLATGDWAEAARVIEESLALPERVKHPLAVELAQGLLAEIDLLEGRPESARARVLSLSQDAYRGVLEEVAPHGCGPLLAQALLELGDLTEAERVVAETMARARAERQPLTLVEALRVAALVAVRQGRLDDAEQDLHEALPLAHALPYPYAEGRLLHDFGQLHIQKAEREPAQERLEAALAIFRRLGARKDSERTEQLLATLG
jgi:tetratricopeptide (TPR) repeat protein